ncbi:MAG: pyridoxal 5'-phosphate synthase glutaminase subunit PdxT [Thermoplasmata archaeon]|nr:pyridoxal 5'-phosphate synthase glutaminase subunit PdxT [Thermoplasmata archaeon]
MIIGILAIQGAVSEHADAFQRALRSRGIAGETRLIRTLESLEGIDGLAIPGGESSTISAQMNRLGMDTRICQMVEEGLPVLGTCAGTILLARRLESDGEEVTNPLGLMDITVRRNAFGRQKESFEHDIQIDGIDGNYRAIFIRAPMIIGLGEGVVSLAKLGEETIIAKQGNMLAMVFHPELTMDTRVHEMFIDIVLKR